jgi:hypothetical protein
MQNATGDTSAAATSRPRQINWQRTLKRGSILAMTKKSYRKSAGFALASAFLAGCATFPAITVQPAECESARLELAPLQALASRPRGAPLDPVKLAIVMHAVETTAHFVATSTAAPPSRPRSRPRP